MLVAAVGADSARIEVCMDCLDVWRGLAKESDVARDDVTRDDVRAVIVPVRNSRHKLKSDLAADQQVAAIADRCARVSQDGDDEDDGFVAI